MTVLGPRLGDTTTVSSRKLIRSLSRVAQVPANGLAVSVAQPSGKAAISAAMIARRRRGTSGRVSIIMVSATAERIIRAGLTCSAVGRKCCRGRARWRDAAMGLRDRIGVDIGRKLPLEDAVAWAAQHA